MEILKDPERLSRLLNEARSMANQAFHDAAQGPSHSSCADAIAVLQLFAQHVLAVAAINSELNGGGSAENALEKFFDSVRGELKVVRQIAAQGGMESVEVGISELDS